MMAQKSKCIKRTWILNEKCEPPSYVTKDWTYMVVPNFEGDEWCLLGDIPCRQIKWFKDFDKAVDYCKKYHKKNKKGPLDKFTV